MKPTILVHAGAGNIRREHFPVEEIELYRGALREALEAGAKCLERGESAVEAVCAAVAVLEDNPRFNAGRGAVYTREGTQEMDACIMRGEDRAAGAVTSVSRIKHPIFAARAVMEKSGHVLLTGEGAERFAASAGVELTEDPKTYFFSERRHAEWEKIQKLDIVTLSEGTTHPEVLLEKAALPPDRKFGTVGAVALDASGHIAAATRTGGMTYKLCGRVVDTPIVGAGTYADDATCAVSATGYGEYFIRGCAASDAAARMRYLKLPLGEALSEACESVRVLGGNGGMIGIDREGNAAFALSSAGMYRGVKRLGEPARVAIFGDEEPGA